MAVFALAEIIYRISNKSLAAWCIELTVLTATRLFLFNRDGDKVSLEYIYKHIWFSYTIMYMIYALIYSIQNSIAY